MRASLTSDVADQTKVNVLGVGVSAINMTDAIRAIDRWIACRDARYVCVTGVHGVIESQRDPDLRRIHNAAGLVTPDGMPLVWLLKQGGYHHASRVYGPDLMLALFAHSSDGRWRHFFYGSSDPVLTQLQRIMAARFPGARIVGSFSPPYRPVTKAEDEHIVRMINDSSADVVWVGLSTPKQERWMAEHRTRLSAPVLIGVGAAFDIHAGMLRQAPRFIQRSGFEWLFRLIMEPRRLWKRYLRNNPEFVLRILQHSLGMKRYKVDI